MKLEEFEIGLAFHQSLIRRKISDKSINEAIDYINNGGGKAPKLYKNVNYKVRVLELWQSAGVSNKFFIYRDKKKSPPSAAAFKATLEVMVGEKVLIAAKAHKVNAQCIYSLRKRLENYDYHAELLANVSKKAL